MTRTTLIRPNRKAESEGTVSQPQSQTTAIKPHKRKISYSIYHSYTKR